MLVKQRLQIGRRFGVGHAEIEAAVARVALCNRNNDYPQAQNCQIIPELSAAYVPWSSTMGFLSATACLISSWQ